MVWYGMYWQFSVKPDSYESDQHKVWSINKNNTKIATFVCGIQEFHDGPGPSVISFKHSLNVKYKIY